MNLKQWGAAMAALGSLAFAGQAQALVYDITFNGTVGGGYDSNVFGGLGDLTGQAFSLTYHINTTAPGVTEHSGVYFEYLDGSGTGLISGEMKIANISAAIGDSNYGRVYEANDGAYTGSLSQIAYYTYEIGSTSHLDQDNYFHSHSVNNYAQLDLYSYMNLLISDGNVHNTPTPYTVGPFDTQSGNFQIHTEDYSELTGDTQTRDASGYLNITSFTVSGTPEPATWGLMLTGFFGTGLMLRRRRTAAVAA